jgi:hypothetical protein
MTKEEINDCQGFQESSCCGAYIYDDSDICSNCKEHCGTVCEDCNEKCIYNTKQEQTRKEQFIQAAKTLLEAYKNGHHVANCPLCKINEGLNCNGCPNIWDDTTKAKDYIGCCGMKTFKAKNNKGVFEPKTVILMRKEFWERYIPIIEQYPDYMFEPYFDGFFPDASIIDNQVYNEFQK